MEPASDILITGGGLSGTALALALAQHGFSVTLVDALPKARLMDNAFDGRSYALALASTRMLSALGVWPRIAEDTQPILEITASDGRAGEGPSPFFLHFDHAEIEEGPMGFMAEDRVLRRGLLEAVAGEKRLTHLSGRTVVAQDVDGATVTLTLDDATTLTGRLLIGCDGRRSGTAARAGIKRTGWDYGQTGLVCAIEHEKPHGGVAHQFFMPSGPLAILPLTGNRSSIVWSEKSDAAQAINALGDDEYLEVLRPRFGDFLGEIKLAGERFTYPLNLTLANSFIAPRVALVGDAAHGVHPIAGQGLNLGLRDVGALAEVLVHAHRRGEDFGAEDVLDRYAQWRRFDTATSALAMDGFNRLFSNDNPLLRTVRDAGLGIVGAMPGLRRRFIREAAGLTGELPRLMQGRVL
ncbi:MAG: FAD-dependent monooxygenase [Brevirhabdus sp.]